MVSQEGNFGNTENALGRVQKNAIILELSEEGVKVLVVFLGETAKDKDVVNVGKAEIQVFKDIVHETERRKKRKRSCDELQRTEWGTE